MLRVLETSNFWLADGTFKVTPKMFYQLYSIHVSLSGIAPACIYAFMPNKTEKIYHRFLEALKILVPDSRPEKMESKGCGIIGFGQNNKCSRGLALWHTVILQWIASQYMESDCKIAKRRFRPKT